MNIAWRTLSIGARSGFILVAMYSSQAIAGCGDHAPGARTGAQILANPISEADQSYDPSVLEKYKNACIISWKGGSRGQAGRDQDEARCNGIPGAKVLRFFPDEGSNFNTCIFAASDDNSNSEEAENSGNDGAAVNAPTPVPRTNQSQPPIDHGTYDIQVCNESPEPKIWVALAHYDKSRRTTMAKGWWIIANGECMRHTADLGHSNDAYFWMHVESPKRKWSQSFHYCVDQHNRFEIPNQAAPCPSPYTLAGFDMYKQTGNGTYTIHVK